jgi:anionic cell wall polymer biosynthesis LytR-Cps2A-Psr (LCP) family protein
VDRRGTEHDVELLDRPWADEESGRDAAAPRRRRRLRRALIALGIAVAVLLLAVAGGAWYLTNRYAGNLDRVGAFEGLDESQRPAPATAGPAGQAPLTFLVVGSDTRADVPEGETPGGRSDVMMLVRFTGDRQDHYAAIDFQGFIQMTDALGGVDVEVAETTTNGPYTYQAGTNHLDGEEALYYVRQRYGLPGGDFDRVKRQQQYLRSMFAKVSQQNVLSDAGALDGFLVALTDAMTVDEELSNSALLSMAYELRSVRPGAVTFLTAPVAGTGREGAQSVVYLKETRAAQMWEYLRTDSLADHAGEFTLDTLPAVPN